MAHQQIQRNYDQYPQARASDVFDGKVGVDDRCGGGRQKPPVSDCGVGYQGGHFRNRFANFVGAAVFADRVGMEKRIEFRTEMSDIRSEIRGLMGEVEGGQLSPEQQTTFDGLVGKIVDIRESYGFPGWRNADAEKISTRILDRFGVEPAPEGANETADTNSVSALQDQVAKLTELVATLQQTLQGLTEKLDGMQTAATEEGTPPTDGTESTTVTALVEEVTVPATETETTKETEPTGEITAAETVTEGEGAADSNEITGTGDVAKSDETAGSADGESIPDAAALAEKLAGVIANASTMMDELLESLAA